MAGEYIERLSLDAAAVNLSRLEGGSVLDAHRQSAVRDVLGSVRKARYRPVEKPLPVPADPATPPAPRGALAAERQGQLL